MLSPGARREGRPNRRGERMGGAQSAETKPRARFVCTPVRGRDRTHLPRFAGEVGFSRFQAVFNAPRRERRTPPRPKKPTSIIAQVAGSGTAVGTAVISEIRKLSPWPPGSDFSTKS